MPNVDGIALAGPWKDKPSISCSTCVTRQLLFVLAEHRAHGFELFEALLTAGKARFMEIQSSDVLLAVMLYAYARDISREKTVFRDAITNALPANGATVQQLPLAFFFWLPPSPGNSAAPSTATSVAPLLALWAAVALPRHHRTKAPLTAIQQADARVRPAAWAFPSAVFLLRGGMGSILDRAHGSMVPGKLMPWRGRPSSPGRSDSGSLRTQKLLSPKPARLVLLVFRFALSDGKEVKRILHSRPCRRDLSTEPAPVLRQCRHPLFAARRRLAR